MFIVYSTEYIKNKLETAIYTEWMNQFDIQPEQEINDREAYNAVLQFMGSQRVDMP